MMSPPVATSGQIAGRPADSNLGSFEMSLFIVVSLQSLHPSILCNISRIRLFLLHMHKDLFGKKLDCLSLCRLPNQA